MRCKSGIKAKQSKALLDLLWAVSLSSAYTGKVYLKMQLTVPTTMPTLAAMDDVTEIMFVLSMFY